MTTARISPLRRPITSSKLTPLEKNRGDGGSVSRKEVVSRGYGFLNASKNISRRGCEEFLRRRHGPTAQPGGGCAGHACGCLMAPLHLSFGLPGYFHLLE